MVPRNTVDTYEIRVHDFDVCVPKLHDILRENNRG